MGRLRIVATPIGNLGDLTPRALAAFREADLIACEDTRKTGLLLSRLGVEPRPRLLAYHEHNEERVTPKLLEVLSAGQTVALCSNAGYPGISDPGYRVIQAAIAAGHPLEVLPGACAVEPALLYAGLPTSSYVFKGFAPRKSGARRRFLELDKDLSHTLVFYESPHRLAKFLAECHEILGDRPAAVCRELTKKFEQIYRGSLSELAEQFASAKVKGEVTVVVGGRPDARRRDRADA